MPDAKKTDEPMTEDRAVNELNKLTDSDYVESHETAEEIICLLLDHLGYTRASAAFLAARERCGFEYYSI